MTWYSPILSARPSGAGRQLRHAWRTPRRDSAMASCIAPDLATIYEVEHGKVSVSGGPVTGWVLRTTTTFRREDGTWKVVHRHADPISTANPEGPLRTT